MMNAKQALAQARAMFGPKAAVQDRRIQTSEAERQAAWNELQALKRAHGKNPSREGHSQMKALGSVGSRYRYQVGTIVDFCGLGGFMIAGQGDTWEEAFKKAAPAPTKKAAA